MRFRVERDVLSEAVSWATRGLPQRPAAPVLAGVLVEAGAEGSLTLSAFDYEVSARITVPADVTEPGVVLVMGRLLADIARNLPDRPVDVSADGNKTQLSCGASRFSLLQMPAQDYPTLPAPPQVCGTVAGDVFTRAVAQVSVAADRGDTLPILTGVRLELSGDRMTLLATDRYRLAMRELSWQPADTADTTAVALVPGRTLSDVARALGATGSVELLLNPVGSGHEGLIGFEAGARRATSRLLDGDYPKVTSIFPTRTDTSAVAQTTALIEAVKRTSLVADRNTPVRLRFTEGQVAIDAGTGEDAQASEALEATVTGPDLEIAFNPHFLLDGLGAVGTAYVRLSFTEPGRPAVLAGQDALDAEADLSYRYVLMPVRFAS